MKRVGVQNRLTQKLRSGKCHHFKFMFISTAAGQHTWVGTLVEVESASRLSMHETIDDARSEISIAVCLNGVNFQELGKPSQIH